MIMKMNKMDIVVVMSLLAINIGVTYSLKNFTKPWCWEKKYEGLDFKKYQCGSGGDKNTDNICAFGKRDSDTEISSNNYRIACTHQTIEKWCKVYCSDCFICNACSEDYCQNPCKCKPGYKKCHCSADGLTSTGIEPDDTFQHEEPVTYPPTKQEVTEKKIEDKPSEPSKPSEEKPSEEKPSEEKPSEPSEPSEPSKPSKPSEEKPLEPSEPSEEKPNPKNEENKPQHDGKKVNPAENGIATPDAPDANVPHKTHDSPDVVEDSDVTTKHDQVAAEKRNSEGATLKATCITTGFLFLLMIASYFLI